MPTIHHPMRGRRTKFQTVCARLTELVHQAGPEAKLPTVLQMRDTLGVSVATVNSALNELEAQGIIHRKHGVGIYVSHRLHHKTIVLLCDPSFFRAAGASPFWSLLVDQARERARAKEEELSFHFALPSTDKHPALHDSLIGEIRSGRVDGILAVGIPPATAEWLAEQGTPLVAFAGPGACMVALDGPAGIRLSVERLAAQGCTRLALWSPVPPFRPSDDDGRRPGPGVEAFRHALDECGLEFDPRRVKTNRHLVPVPGSVTTETHQEQGYRTAYEVFGAAVLNRPDGIVLVDDMMAQGALIALRNLGVVVGEDVKVASHANRGSNALLGHEDALNRVEIDPSEVVHEMFDLLGTLMKGETPPQKTIWIQPRLTD